MHWSYKNFVSHFPINFGSQQRLASFCKTMFHNLRFVLVILVYGKITSTKSFLNNKLTYGKTDRYRDDGANQTRAHERVVQNEFSDLCGT